MMKVLFIVCAILGISLATIDSNLEEDDFRMLKRTHDGDAVFENKENAKRFWGDGKLNHDLIAISTRIHFDVKLNV